MVATSDARHREWAPDKITQIFEGPVAKQPYKLDKESVDDSELLGWLCST